MAKELRKGLTILEMLVAMVVFTIIASLVYAVFSHFNRVKIDLECLKRAQLISSVLMNYRADWGDATGVVGTAEMLGLPFSAEPIPFDKRR
ncbi:MAG: type II secretion system protein [Candidatus Nitrosotenuis sp.]